MEDNLKAEEHFAKQAAELYPYLMKTLGVWGFIVAKIAHIFATIFSLALLAAIFKALWWVVFIWRW